MGRAVTESNGSDGQRICSSKAVSRCNTPLPGDRPITRVLKSSAFVLLVVISNCFLAAPLATAAVEVIAHRGASGQQAPENTLSAIQSAWKEGCDCVEIDVHLSRDGHAVVIHDRTVDRTTNGIGRVSDLTISELRKLRISWKGGVERIPTLAEVLKTIPERGRLFVELKCGPEILPELKRLIDESGKKCRQIVIISFDYHTLARSRKALPQFKHYWLTMALWSSMWPDIISRAKLAEFDGVNVDFRMSVSSASVAAAHAAGLKVYAFTINHTSQANEALDYLVDGITTDEPALVQQLTARPIGRTAL